MENYKIQNVLMPTDFSELSSSAFKTAVAICKRQNAQLTLLHVVEEIPNIPIDDLVSSPNNLIEELIETYSTRIVDMAKELTLQTGIVITGKVERGNIADTICSIAFEESYNLIVMGTHGTSGMREFFIGSNAFSVVKKATCPVLTIPSNWGRIEFKKVIFPVRETIDVIAKYNLAKPIINKNNSSIKVLSLYNADNDNVNKELTKLVDLLKEKLNEDKVSFSSVSLPPSKFPEQVLEHATDFDADLIIITANLDYGFKAYFLGPYSQQLVNHSKIPVLSVKPKIDTIEKEEDQFTEIDSLMRKYGSSDPLAPAFQ